jgi:hypothetical protein
VEERNHTRLHPARTPEEAPLQPSLREKFVNLPGGSEVLTPEQLDAVFGGDRGTLRDLARLILIPCQNPRSA